MKRIYFTEDWAVALACALEVGKDYEAVARRAADCADLREVGGKRTVANVPLRLLGVRRL